MKMGITAKNILKGLNEALEFEKGKRKLRTTTVQLPGPAREWTPKEIKAVRMNKFRVSQPIFATILNVSPETVRAWEQGQKSPGGSARRLLEVAFTKPRVLFEVGSKNGKHARG